MSLGPYKINGSRISYIGNKIYEPIEEVRKIKPPQHLTSRHLQVRNENKKWEALIKIWDGVFKASNAFMESKDVLLFDLPITTRMISSPGALTGTISSDVDPFEIKFFDKKTFLTQSSQLYLEFAITNPGINSVYCWEKSFRRERADFRHLPEFTHIEFEANIGFEKNLELQQKYLQFLVGYLIEKNLKELKVFLKQTDLEKLGKFTKIKKFKRIEFNEAFKLLEKKMKRTVYKNPTIRNFGVYEEVALGEIIDEPCFVTHYIEEEVAFYHAKDPRKQGLVINADFLLTGYGELIGSGERVHTKEETSEKALHFKLNMEDYQPYIDSRDSNPQIHSGWGMGIERFIQCILKLPFIWEAKAFPRVDNQNHP